MRTELRNTFLLVGLIVFSMAGCGSAAGSADAGTVDAGTPDAGTPDAGTSDAGMADAGHVDAGCEVLVGVAVGEQWEEGICTVTATSADAGNPDTVYTFAQTDGGTVLTGLTESWGLVPSCVAKSVVVGSTLYCSFAPSMNGCYQALVIGGFTDGLDAGCEMDLP